MIIVATKCIEMVAIKNVLHAVMYLQIKNITVHMVVTMQNGC